MTLGIDVGGTNLVLGLVQDGKIVKRVSTPWFPREANLEQTIDTLSEQIAGILIIQIAFFGIIISISKLCQCCLLIFQSAHGTYVFRQRKRASGENTETT